MKCAFCGESIKIDGKPGRNDNCPKCNNSLRCCRQCKFFDPHSYNECREVSAERVVDKDRANFCDYFVFRGSSQKRVNKTQDARNALEALFRKSG